MRLKEIWRPVRGFKNFYEVSNKGGFRSLKGFKNWKRKEITMLKTYREKNGYYRVRLNKNSVQELHFIHRLVAESFLGGNRKSKLQINHKNGIKSDNRPENLEWMTRKENMTHGHSTGLFPRGDKHPSSKIPSYKLEEIKNSALSCISLAKIYGVNRSSIYRIKIGKTRLHG